MASHIPTYLLAFVKRYAMQGSLREAGEGVGACSLCRKREEVFIWNGMKACKQCDLLDIRELTQRLYGKPGLFVYRKRRGAKDEGPHNAH